MSSVKQLFDNNRIWAARIVQTEPDFFEKLSAQQSPKFMWVGCSDSRVPANEIVGLLPGELFVHRNVANLVVHTDLNCLSVLQYAVDVLGVRHVIVCGHYGCGGVRAAIEPNRLGLIDNWLRHVQDVHEQHHAMVDAMADHAARVDRLCELNVIEQVRHVCQTTIVQEAWERGQRLSVHGWIYGLHDGRLRSLGLSASCLADVSAAYPVALAEIGGVRHVRQELDDREHEGEQVMTYFVLQYDVVDDYVNRRAPFRDEHLRLVRQARARGVVTMAGALGDPPDGALLIFRSQTPVMAEAFARADPYVQHGLVTQWRVRPWQVVDNREG